MKRLDKIQIRPSKEQFEFRLWLDGQRQPVEFETLASQAASIAEVIRDFLVELKIPSCDRPSNPFCFVEVPAPRGTPELVEEKTAPAQPKLRVVKPEGLPVTRLLVTGVTQLTRVVGLRLGQDDAPVERQGVKLDGQAGAAAVRPGCADASPKRLFVRTLLDALGSSAVVC